ncbi:MAG: FliH/SctL family protein [Lachnospiraceae bacterium]
MTILSSKGTVKVSDQVVEIYKFIPPVESSRKFWNEERPDHQDAVLVPASSNWQPAGGAESAHHESTGILESAQNDARQLLLKSRQRAMEILREAREQARQIKAQAADEGYRSGAENGFKQGVDRAVRQHGKAMECQMAEFHQDIDKALAAVAEAKEKVLRNYLEELKDCSVAVAEKVIHISLKSSGEIIKRMIIAETERLKKTAWVKIYMEKTDYEMMLKADQDVVGELSRLSDNIKFIVMDKENSGNCIIEMPDEIIDISVDTQLENIKEILQNVGI